MKTQRQFLGRLGEDLAAKFLQKNGYRILSRNWKCKFGELDIVAQKFSGKIFKRTECVVFVEVKTIDAYDARFESQAEQNVHYFKQQHLKKSAQCYLKANKVSPEIPWQIDVVAIEYDNFKGLHKIRHLQNAVW